nr:hypothetical protein [Tanacetum cinerariifolium]
MVAYLSKSDAIEGFNQIIDFLNGSSIKYVLTVNPNISVSCIKQFLTTVVVKQVNDITRLQALVDNKKEEIFAELARMGYEKPSTKLTFYKAFFSSQWKFLIHTILQCMSAKRTSWNKFCSSMASAVIYPLQVQPTPPQSLQIQPPSPRPQPQPQPQQDARIPMNLLQDLIDICTALTRIVKHLEFDKVAQALEITKLKRRVKKLERRNKVRVLTLRRLQRVRTTRRVKTSNETVLDDVSNQGRMIAEMDHDADVVLEDDTEVADEAKEVVNAVKDVEESSHDQGRKAESHAKIYKIDLDHANKVDEERDADKNVEEVNVGDAAEEDVSAAHGEVQPTPPQSLQIQPPSPRPQPQPQQDARIPMNLLQDLMDICTALTRIVKHLEFDKVAQALEITKLKRRVKKLERRNKVRVLTLRRLQRVRTTRRVETSNETVLDDVSNQGSMIAEMDHDADVVLEDDTEVADEAKEVVNDVKDVEESSHDQGRKPESHAKIYKIDLDHANKVLSMQEDETEPAEV